MAKNHVSTTNACKMCTPMGACLAFRGVKGSMPFIHGSQGCATYMRRYLISHFREPVDIASSSLGEKHAVFGGGPNLKKGILNVHEKYQPEIVGVSSTCLTETIGDDLKMITEEFLRDFNDIALPYIVTVSTPSYHGTHINGWKLAVRAMVEKFASPASSRSLMERTINFFPNFLSPADIRHLKGIFREFGIKCVILPDISETLDSPSWEEYLNIPPGGTSVEDISKMSDAIGSIECGTLTDKESAGIYLENKFDVKNFRIDPPIGLRGTDSLMRAIEQITGTKTPSSISMQRGRLVDSLVDGHKYLNGKKAVIFGDEDFVTGMVSFIAETGVKPVIAATGGNSNIKDRIKLLCEDLCDEPLVLEDADFDTIEKAAIKAEPHLMIGNSKGYKISKKLGIPLIRAGFPIHDRFGSQRILHVGYDGALNFLDKLVNTIMHETQESTKIGYGYI